MLPDGPLHPEIAWPALMAGLVVVAIAMRARTPDDAAWAYASSSVVALALMCATDGAPWRVLEPFGTGARFGTVALALGAGAAMAVAARVSTAGALLAVAPAIAASWGTVPDTEWPLALGAAALPAFALTVWRRPPPSLTGAACTAVVGVAFGLTTGIGARARPGRVWPPTLALLVLLAGALVATSARGRRGRSASWRAGACRRR